MNLMETTLEAFRALMPLLVTVAMRVRELGDFSVTYRVAGLLKDVQSSISARSALRMAMLDALHGAGIEIVSPSFMNQRPQSDGTRFIPRALEAVVEVPQASAEEVVFDKAEQAASVKRFARRSRRSSVSFKPRSNRIPRMPRLVPAGSTSRLARRV